MQPFGLRILSIKIKRIFCLYLIILIQKYEILELTQIRISDQIIQPTASVNPSFEQPGPRRLFLIAYEFL